MKLLNHFDIKNKLVSYHKFNEKTKSLSLIDDLLNGKSVALISDAGTPCISDPGYNLVSDARKSNIEVIGIPGASATVTALSVSGLPTSSYTFLGFLSSDTSKFNEEIDLIYESPKRLVKLVEKLSEEFKSANIYIASDLTKIHERGFFGNINEVLKTIKEDPNIEKGEYVIILDKNEEKQNKEDDSLSLEALLIDTMIKNNLDMKSAISYINDNYKNIKKNDIYKASLNLKDIFNWHYNLFKYFY